MFQSGLRSTSRKAVASVILCAMVSASALLLHAGQPETINVIPTQIVRPLPNPYMGWGIWVGTGVGFYTTYDKIQPRLKELWHGKAFTVAENTTGFMDDAPLFNWVMVDWDWAVLEPTEGKIDWTDFDAVVSYWKARGKQFVVRLWVTDDPGWSGQAAGRPVLPGWLWQKGVRSREYQGNGGSKVREIDYADPSYEKIYLPALQKLLRSFAERYDQPGTPVIFLQVMGYGHWADYGTWYSHYPWSSAQAEHDVLSKLMDVHIQTFRHIQLFEMAAGEWNKEWDTSVKDRLYRKALDVAVAHNFGLIWTGFIDALDPISRQLMSQCWHSNPVFAEVNWGYDDMVGQGTHGTVGENLDLGLEWHANFEHFYSSWFSYNRAIQNDRDCFERGLRSGGLGYRLVPVSLSWQSELPAGNLMVFRQTWVNRNVGRLYVPHWLKLSLTDSEGNEKFGEIDSSFDPTAWVKGEEYTVSSVFHLKKDLAPGTYDVRIALVDERGNPRINLGIEGRDSQGRYKVGEIRILPALHVAGCDTDYCP